MSGFYPCWICGGKRTVINDDGEEEKCDECNGTGAEEVKERPNDD